MIDTIKLFIPAEELKHLDLLAELPLLLDADTVNYHQKNNHDYIEGKIDNITVSIYETGVSLFGSLSRFYFGDNFNTLSYNQIELAFKKLGEKLNIPIEKGKLQRLDIAENYIVEYPVFHYYQLLGDLPRYNRTEQSNGIYYNQTSFQICIYDKVNEKMNKRKEIPEEFKGLNVFRYEFRFLKKVGTNLCKKPVYVSDLLNPEFFKEILTVYITKFDNVNKLNEVAYYPEIYAMDRAEFWRHIEYAGIQALGGENHIIKTIKVARKHKAFKHSTQVVRMIQDVKKVCELGQFNVKSRLVEELEGKFTYQIRKYIENI